MIQLPKSISFIIGAFCFLFLISPRFYQSVPVGHVGVATLFGEVQSDPFPEGLHIPVNPLYEWHLFDVRQKTHSETSNVPSQDQLQTRIDVSVQYRLEADDAPRILRKIGSIENVRAVLIVPKLRSLIRKQGKTIKRAEDFSLEATQTTLQTALLEGLKDFLEPKGVVVEGVLIRDISLPSSVSPAPR